MPLLLLIACVILSLYCFIFHLKAYNLGLFNIVPFAARVFIHNIIDNGACLPGYVFRHCAMRGNHSEMLFYDV